MTRALHMTEADWAAVREKHAAMTPEQARAWLQSVIGPPRRTLEGKERSNILLILSFKDPVSESNNQHSWTTVYEHDGKEYHITSFSDSDVVVDEILPVD